ncbi:hypothetical protein ACTWP5_29750 [Streptomyces sp. 4N509B]
MADEHVRVTRDTAALGPPGDRHHREPTEPPTSPVAEPPTGPRRVALR